MEYAKVLTDMVVVKYAEELALDQENVSRLADSIEELGLLNPITVVKDPDNYLGQSYTMVAGRHRLAAVQKLGWDEVDAIILDCEPTDTRTRRLAEIAENLHRKELTKLERSKLVAEWVELVGGEKPVQVAQVSGGRGIEGGDSKAARDLGLSRYEVLRSKKVAGLTDEAVEAAKELGLDDNQTALLKAAREKTAEAQVAALEGHVVKSDREKAPETPRPCGPFAVIARQLRQMRREELLRLKQEIENILKGE